MKGRRLPRNLATLLWLFLLLQTHRFAAGVATARPLQKSLPGNTQIQNIVEALVGAGDFGGWANVLYGTDPSTLPVSTTLFVPSDEGLAHLSLQDDFTPEIIQYHIVPHQLTYYDLQQFEIGMRIPTLLPNKTILITNNTKFNFTIDDSPITHPDIYRNGLIVVHGIRLLLNSSLYGSELLPGNFTHHHARNLSPPPPPPEKTASGDDLSNQRSRPSDAPCQCTEFPVILSAVSAIFAVKLLRNPARC